MSVLNRKLFNRGGRVSSRGVGITSGLATPRRGYVDRPGSYAGHDGAETSLPSRFDELFQEKEKQGALYHLEKTLRFQAATPALLNFFSNLKSGRSLQGDRWY